MMNAAVPMTAGDDLTACGRHRLHRAGKFGFVARFFHQRDGEHAGTDHVAHGASGDHTQTGAGHNGDLCRTAAAAAEAGGRHAHDGVARAQLLQKTAEQQQEEDVLA